MIKKLLKTNEFVVFLILVGLSVVIQLINPAFFTISTLFDTLRGATVYYILAFALLPIIIAGGVDMASASPQRFSLAGRVSKTRGSVSTKRGA